MIRGRPARARGGARWSTIAGLGLLIAGQTVACRTPAPTPPAPPPSATAKPPPPNPVDPCQSDCRALAEATLERDPMRGLRLLRACLDCADPTPSTYARVADLLGSRGGSTEALTTLRAGTARHPRAALLWRLRGRLALRTGAPREGLEALERAHQLQPNAPGLAAEIATAERQHGPDDVRARRAAEPWLEEAERAAGARDFRGAQQALDKALELADGVPELRADVRRRLALVAFARGDAPGAQRSLEAALTEASRPGALRAAILLAHSDVLLALDETDTALISATAAAEMAPEDPLAPTNVAIARARRREWKAALTALRQAIDRGLPSRITRSELLAISGLAKLAERDDFRDLVDGAWPQ